MVTEYGRANWTNSPTRLSEVTLKLARNRLLLATLTPIWINTDQMTSDCERLRTYWRFYWPLTLTGLALILSIQLQNATLARFPNAVVELAIFALAQSTFALFSAMLNFTPQLSNLFCRSPHARRVCWRFISSISVLLTLLLVLLASTRTGQGLLTLVYGLDAALLSRVCDYLIFLAPVLFVNAQRFYLNGLLVQARLTGWVTILNVLFLSATLVLLILGLTNGYSALHTLCGAQFFAALLHWVTGLAIRRKRYQPPTSQEHQQLSYSELFKFFLPVTTTGLMFALSRPVLYAFVARTPDALISIAALRIGFDFSMMFQQAANQFRSFFITFGLDDIDTKKRFMWLVGVLLTVVMGLFVLTPLSRLVLSALLGAGTEVLDRAIAVIGIMCALPALIIWRNFHHGVLMVRRQTNSMAVGGILRVATIALAAHAVFNAGALTHQSAAGILLMGFLTEALVVTYGSRQHRPQ